MCVYKFTNSSTMSSILSVVCKPISLSFPALGAANNLERSSWKTSKCGLTDTSWGHKWLMLSRNLLSPPRPVLEWCFCAFALLLVFSCIFYTKINKLLLILQKIWQLITNSANNYKLLTHTLNSSLNLYALNACHCDLPRKGKVPSPAYTKFRVRELRKLVQFFLAFLSIIFFGLSFSIFQWT